MFGSSWDAISDAGIDPLRSVLKCGTLPALKISDTNICNIEILVAELEHVRNIRGLTMCLVTDDTVPTLWYYKVCEESTTYKVYRYLC